MTATSMTTTRKNDPGTRSRRAVLAGAAAAAAGVLQAACGGPAPAAQGTAGTGSGPAASGTVRFSFFGSIEEKAIWEKMAQQFAATAPAVTMVPEHVPSQYFTKIQTAVAGGDAADVILMEDKPTAGYAKKGFFKELDPFISADPTFKRDDYYTVLFDGLKYRGKLYGLPLRQTYLPAY